LATGRWHDGPAASHRRPTAGFSLVELIVVMLVAVVLTGLLLPVLSRVRENAYRVVCASNQRTLGMSIFMYTADHKERLPESSYLSEFPVNAPEGMVAFRDEVVSNGYEGGQTFVSWDGLGLLFQGGYCDRAECFYCPSHTGEHTFDVYEHMWTVDSPGGRVYTNYHYSGHLDWVERTRRSLDQGKDLVLITDGLRTRLDFNHQIGVNVLTGDGAVVWKDDSIGLFESLPVTALSLSEDPAAVADMRHLWVRISDFVTNK
jgi:type II secretory pathway pseudopilin PulG